MTQARHVSNPLGSFEADWFPKVIASEGELEKLVERNRGSEKAVVDMLAKMYHKDRLQPAEARQQVLAALGVAPAAPQPTFAPL